MDKLQNRLERLLKRLLEGGVVPFVGAGISMAARVPGSQFEPSVNYLEKLLRAELEKDLNNEKSRKSLGYQTIQSLASPPCSKQPCCESGKPSFAWLAELGALLWGHGRLCEVLQIEKFAELEPLPAHRYLAYLAREGLITEIISTNYDCCIEKALLASFGNETPPQRILAVISSLAEYRATGGRLLVGGQPVLHLYKINGCAKAYRDTRLQAIKQPTPENRRALRKAAERIILTERQLQSFRNERWAEDFFRDRARTRNLLFCGFGSEEPQVRHTALALVAEFQQDFPQDEPLSLEKVATLPNAPFMASYSRNPSFTQLQILAAFVQAHIHQADQGILASITHRIAPLLLNFFSGRDASQLQHSKLDPSEQKLGADLFLKWLYQGAFHHLVQCEMRDGTLFFNWLKRLTPYPRSWQGYLRVVLCPDKEKCLDQNSEHEPIPYYLGSWHDLLERTGERGPLRLWSWLWAMYNPMQAEKPPEDWYLPLREDSLFVLSTLLVLCCLTSKVAKQKDGQKAANQPEDEEEADCYPIPQAQPVNDCGLQVKLPANQAVPAVVYLVHEHAATRSRMSGAVSLSRSRLIRRIALPSARYSEAEERWIVESPYLEPTGGQAITSLRIGRQELIAAEDLIRSACKPGNLLNTLSQTYAAARPARRAKLEPL